MIKISSNNLLNIARYEGDLSKLSFLSKSGLKFSMNKMMSNLTSSTHLELLKDFDGDISETASMLEKLQIALNASSSDLISEGIDLKELFDVESGQKEINVLGISIRKGGQVDKDKIKKMLIKNAIGVDPDEYKRILKIARSKKTDNISLPINPTEKEKVLYLALKALEGSVYDMTSKIQKELSLYRKLRMDYTPQELDVIDSKINGFSRTMVDGVIQNSTYFTANEIVQLSSKHQKTIGAMDVIKRMQSVMKRTGIVGIEVDSDDSLNKMYQLVLDADYFTMNLNKGVVLKSRKLGNYAGRGFNLFGMYMPDSSIVAVDSRDPSALSHEFSHYVDFKNSFMSDEIRGQFIGRMKHLLERQYVDNCSTGDVVNAYLTLKEGGFDEDVIEMLGDDLDNYIKDDIKNLTRFSETLSSDRLKVAMANKIESSLIRVGYSKEDAFKKRVEFLEKLNQFKAQDYNGDVIAERVLKNGSNTFYAKELDDEMKEYINFRGKKLFEKIKNEPPHYGYLSKPTEIIARAGELAFVLMKYGYKGHSNPFELNEFFERVRKIQNEEMKDGKRIRGCHHIDTYLKDPSYFGFRDLTEETLLMIKSYYKGFFKPNRVLKDAIGGKIIEEENNDSVSPLKESHLRDLFESQVRKEFARDIIIKEMKERRRNKTGSRFNKDEYPLSHLGGFDDLQNLLMVNEEEGVMSQRELCSYLVENIKYLGRTTKSENVDLDKIKIRLDSLAELLANKDSYENSMRESLEIIERGLLDAPRGTPAATLRHSLLSEDGYGLKLLDKSAKDFDMGLTYGGSPLGIKEFVFELSKKENPSQTYERLNSYFSDMLKLRDENKASHNYRISPDFIDSAEYMEDFSKKIDEDLKNLKESSSLDEKLYYHLKALQRLAPLQNHIDVKTDLMNYLVRGGSVDNMIGENALRIINDFGKEKEREPTEFHFEDSCHNYKYGVRNKNVSLDIFSDSVKALIYDELMSLRNGDKYPFTAKAHIPKKELKTEEQKAQFISERVFRNVDTQVLRGLIDKYYKVENVSHSEYERIKGKINSSLSFSFVEDYREAVRSGTLDRSILSELKRIRDFLENRDDIAELLKDKELFKLEYLKSKIGEGIVSPKKEGADHYRSVTRDFVLPLLRRINNEVSDEVKELGREFFVDAVNSVNPIKMDVLMGYAAVLKSGLNEDKNNVFDDIFMRRKGAQSPKNEERDKKTVQMSLGF